MPAGEGLLRRALLRHIKAERARDVGAITVSLHPDPYYIIPGYELRGASAVRALYECNLAALTSENADEYARALTDPRVAHWAENHLILEYTPDYPLHYGITVIAHLVEAMLRSEHTFLSLVDPQATRPALMDIPGVTPIAR